LNSQFILTGAPGAGKTVVLRQLEAMGHVVVEEAATDVIALAQAKGVAEPHLDPTFIDAIVTLQEQRRRRSASPPLLGEGKRMFRAPTTFHDRSPICTLALAHYLGFPVSGVLTRALRFIEAEQFYARRVFFLRNLGFIVNTEARRISFEDTLRFEQVHEDVYRQLGYELVFIDAAEAEERAGRVVALVSGA
jgi:predicted ATPase